MIAFDPETHVYRVDGRVVPSVSEVLKAAGLGPDYSAIDPDVLAHARDRGIYVEKCCQDWADGVFEPDPDYDGMDPEHAALHKESLPYVAAFQRFAQNERLETCAWQKIGFDAVADVAGTCDLVTSIRGALAVIDLKCTTKIYRSYRIQLAAYRRMQDLTTARWVLQLREDGDYRLKDCDRWETEEHGQDEITWLAAVALYRWKHHGNGRK